MLQNDGQVKILGLGSCVTFFFLNMKMYDLILLNCLEDQSYWIKLKHNDSENMYN